MDILMPRIQADARYAKKQALNAQRLEDCKNGAYALGGGVVDPLPADAPFFVKDYYDYYKTPRGYHPRSLNSNGGWNVTGCMSFLNQPILQYSSEIRSAVLLVHGEKAHSCYFSRDAYAAMVEGSPYADNKELLLLPRYRPHRPVRRRRQKRHPVRQADGIFPGVSGINTDAAESWTGQAEKGRAARRHALSGFAGVRSIAFDHVPRYDKGRRESDGYGAVFGAVPCRALCVHPHQTKEQKGALLQREHSLAGARCIRQGDLVGTRGVTIHIDTPVHAPLAVCVGRI